MLLQSAAIFHSIIKSKIQACRKKNIKNSSNIFGASNQRKMNTETLNSNISPLEKITTSWDFMNEDDWHEEIDCFPGEYDEEYGIEADFCDKIDEVISLNLGKALIRLETVLEKFPIHHISVTVDLNGMENTDAFCMNSGSNQESGENNIGIGIGPGMVKSFLEKHFYANAYTNPYYELNFDHELIHGMDQNLWAYNPKGISPETPKEFILNYLLKYQSEGLACFSTFLRGMLAEKSFNKAANKFQKNWAIVTSFSEQNPENWQTISNKLKSHSYDPYNLGPMMVLQALNVKASLRNDLEQIQLLTKAMNIEVLTNDEINQLIIAGLELSFPEFVTGLYKPDASGRSFMPKEMLLPALDQVNSWSNFLTDDQQTKSEERTPISTLEEELDSIKHLDDEMLELKKLELDYNITIRKEYQQYQIKCDEFYRQIL
jgi:hypothetical protein